MPHTPETHVEGDILTPQGWIRGRMRFSAEILAFDGVPASRPQPPYVLPGFIDLHCHGGGGADVMRGTRAVRRAAQTHAAFGTTAFAPTTVTAPGESIARALTGIAEAMAQPRVGARVLGAHLEGPFLNPGKLGAQPPYAAPADAAAFTRWSEIAPIRVATLAPEIADAALIQAAQTAGARLQIGHTLCDYAAARACLAQGWGVTHLFNAMTPCAHRANGAAGAALAHADFAEIIPDLIHVEPGAILAARRAIPSLYGVTDATAGAGAPDGPFPLGDQTAHKSGGVMRLTDGTLAGSCLTMDQALRNLVSIGLPLREAAQMLSTRPADWIGETRLGRLAPGCAADFNVFDAELTCARTVIAGEAVYSPFTLFWA